MFARVFAVHNCIFYGFSLVFALVRRNKGKFLFAADRFIRKTCGAVLRNPYGSSLKPSVLESKIHPPHEASICTLGISPWQGGKTGSPPEKEGAREKRRQLQQQGKEKHARKKSFDRER